MHFVYHYLTTAGLFVVIDAIWLTTVANSFYKSNLKHLLKEKPNLQPAVLFYLIYMAAIVVFVVDPGLKLQSFSFVLGHGALLGLAMYATYDLTNHSTIKDWPAKVTYVDLVWGTFITTLTGVIVYFIY